MRKKKSALELLKSIRDGKVQAITLVFDGEEVTFNKEALPCFESIIRSIESDLYSQILKKSYYE